MNEVINREVTEESIVFTLEDGTSRSIPRELSDELGEIVRRGMALLEAEGHSEEEAGAWVKQHVERIIRRRSPDEAPA